MSSPGKKRRERTLAIYKEVSDEREVSAMPELRRHYFLDEYCIIAAERKKRPSDFRIAKPVAGDEAVCPFCPGNEEMTPPAVAVYSDAGMSYPMARRGFPAGRCVSFPMFSRPWSQAQRPPTTEWIALPGQGYHEVIVDTPQHKENPADFSRSTWKNSSRSTGIAMSITVEQPCEIRIHLQELGQGGWERRFPTAILSSSPFPSCRL